MYDLQELTESISEERLAPYRANTDNDKALDPHARYLWNTALGESLFPSLQAIEITLRNSFHMVISSDSGSENWFEKVLDPKDLPALEEIRNRLCSHNLPSTPGQIVANSDLGFWVRLLNSRYESVLWPRLLQAAFPFMPNVLRTRKNLSKRMNSIRALRNRVFHYEPIWNDSSLEQKHQKIREAIGWLSPAAMSSVGLLDRFPEVFKSGFGPYEAMLKANCKLKDS